MTIYSLNTLPFGGFVKLAGQEDPNIKDGLAAKPAGIRFIILVAGPLMNALLPIVLFSIAFMIPQEVVIGEVIVEDLAANSPAELAGIEVGDVILEIDGHIIRNNIDMSRYIQLNLGENTEFKIEHQSGSIDLINIIPRWTPPEGEGAIGVVISTREGQTITESKQFFDAISGGVIQLQETLILFKNGILSLIAGTTEGGIAGPIGIAQITGEVAQAGIVPLLEFTAFFSLNLAFLNILPLPALDGGRLVFVTIEWIRRGKRVSPKMENRIHFIGFAILIAILLAVTLQDIMRIISGDSIFP
jgi:regulator of sigma E protease